MAGIARRLKISAAISAVYTPPELRGRGYAGVGYSRNGGAHLCRGSQSRLPLCGPQKPRLDPLLYKDWLHAGLQIPALP